MKKKASWILSVVLILSNLSSTAAFAGTGREDTADDGIALLAGDTAGEQITVTKGDAESYVKELLGDNISIVPGSAKMTVDNEEQMGVFTGGTELTGIDRGLVLSSGNCAEAFVRKNSGNYTGSCQDPDLNKLVTNGSGRDSAILEFELEATGSLLNFQYVFASCEFDQSESYNDVFGLFVSVNGGSYENIALLPGGDPVSITNLKKNTADNLSVYTPGNFLGCGFDGITNIFTAQKAVSVGDKVAIKIGICDVGDSTFDSSVMIKSNSISFNPPGAKPGYREECLTGLDPDSVYKISCEGTTYEITSDGDGRIPLVGKDDSGQSYDFFGKEIRIVKKGSGDIPDSPAQDLTVNDRPVAPEDPTAPTNTPEDINTKDITTTTSSITVAAREGQEYSVDGGNTWVVPSGDPLTVVFDGLDANKEYTVQTRYGATDSEFASRPSGGVTVRTDDMLGLPGGITVTDYTDEYDGNGHHGVVTAPEHAVITYASGADGTYTESEPEFFDVGQYTYYYCVSKPNYYNAYGKVDVAIQEKSLTVIPDSGQGKNVGQKDGTLRYRYSGAAGLETPAFTGALSRLPGETAGTYEITLGTLGLADGTEGFKKANYKLVFPATGDKAVSYVICAVDAVDDDFTVEGAYSDQEGQAGWNRSPIVVTPENGYTQVSTDGVNWSDSITGDLPGKEQELVIYLKKEDGTVTSPKTIYYNLDTQSPEMTGAAAGGQSMAEAGKGADLHLIFSDETTVLFSGSDAVSGIASFTYELADGTTHTVQAADNQAAVSIAPQYSGTIRVWAADLAGNVSPAKTYEKIIVDGDKATAPSVHTGSYDADTWTPGPVTLTAGGAQSLGGIRNYQYSVDGGITWKDMETLEAEDATAETPYNALSASAAIDGAGITSCLFRAVANSGLGGEIPEPVRVKIDPVKPVVVVDDGGYDGRWTRDKVTFTLSNAAENLSGVTYEYTTDGGQNWQALTGNRLEIDGDTDGSYAFRAVSGAGLPGEASKGCTVRVRQTPPENATVGFSPAKTGGWYTSVPAITVTPPSDTAGVPKVYYQLYEEGGTPGEWILQEDTMPVVPGQGQYVLKVRTADEAGNESAVLEEKIWLDTEAPVSEEPDVKAKNKGLLAHIGNFLTFGNFFREEVEICLPVSDNQSGVSAVEYQLPGNEGYQKAELEDTKNLTKVMAIFDVPMGTDGVIKIKLTDVAGNVSQEFHLSKDGSDIWVIEADAPVISDITTTEVSVNGWYKNDVLLSAVVKDERSGLNKVTSTINTEDEILIQDLEKRLYAYTYHKTVTDNGKTTVTIKAEDNATNTAAVKSISLLIDKEQPKLTAVSGNPQEWTNQNVDITFRLVDKYSGIDESSVKVVKDGKEVMPLTGEDGVWTFTTDGNGVYTVKARDIAGNEIETGNEENQITVKKIQTEPPVKPDLDEIDSNIIVGGDPDGQEGRPAEKDGWYTKADVEIGLVNPPSEEESPGQQYCYKIRADGEDPDAAQTVRFDGTNPPVISLDGVWNVTVWLEDEAGNRSEEVTKTIKLDTTIPGAFARTKNFTVKNNKAQKAEVKLTDAVSGVRRDSIKVLFEGKEMPVTVTEKDGVYTCDFEVEKGGIYTVQCTDEAGNKKEFAVTATALTAEIECSEGIFGTADREELLGAVDLSAYKKGECVELNMRLEAREESGIPKDVRDGMSRKAGEQARFYYFDLAFKKSVTVGGQTVEEAVKVTDKEVTVTILIPEALRGKYNYQILRESEGNYEILQGQVSKDGTKITFATDKSSTYALTCTDKKTVTEDVKKVVQTGDPTETTGWLGLMMGMAVGIGLLLRRRIKK